MSASPIVRQHRVAAVGVACAAREVAAGHVDFDAAAGPKRVVDVAEADGQPLDRRPEQAACGSPDRVAIHRADDPVHQQHRAAVGQRLDQLGDEIGVRAIRSDVQRHPHIAGDGQMPRAAARRGRSARNRARPGPGAGRAGRRRSACCARRSSGSAGAGHSDSAAAPPGPGSHRAERLPSPHR